MWGFLTPAFLTSSSSHLGPCHWRMASWSGSLTILLWSLFPTPWGINSALVPSLFQGPTVLTKCSGLWSGSLVLSFTLWPLAQPQPMSRQQSSRAAWHWPTKQKRWPLLDGFSPGRWVTKGGQRLSLLERIKSYSLLNFLEFSVTLKRSQDSGLWNLGVLGHSKDCQKVRTRNPEWSRPQPKVMAVEMGAECSHPDLWVWLVGIHTIP